MKKIIFFLPLLILTCINDIPELDKKQLIYDEVFALVKSTKTGYAKRKTECITNSSARHNLHHWYFTKLGLAESSLHIYTTNHNSTCFGLYQINTNHWLHLPFHVFDKKYARYLRKHEETNVLKVLQFIGVNTECGAIVLRDALDRSDGCYKNALSLYGGWGGVYGKRYPERKNKYIRKIIDD